MFQDRTSPPAAVYLIADHLDAALAAGEDMRKLHIDIPPALCGFDSQHARALRVFVDDLHRHELTLLLHVIEARKRAGEIDSAPKVLRSILALFTGGTAALADATAQCGDPAQLEFATSGDPLDYLRSREILPHDSGSLIGRLELSVPEEMLIAERVPLGDVLNHAAAVLDALELCFDIYSDNDAADVETDAGAAETALDRATTSPSPA